MCAHYKVPRTNHLHKRGLYLHLKAEFEVSPNHKRGAVICELIGVIRRREYCHQLSFVKEKVPILHNLVFRA